MTASRRLSPALTGAGARRRWIRQAARTSDVEPATSPLGYRCCPLPPSCCRYCPHVPSAPGPVCGLADRAADMCILRMYGGGVWWPRLWGWAVLSSAKIGTGSWRYYTAGVACRASEYYLGVGEAPGRWHGRGLEQLGLTRGLGGDGAGARGAVRPRPAPEHRRPAGAGVADRWGDRVRPDVLRTQECQCAVGAGRLVDGGAGDGSAPRRCPRPAWRIWTRTPRRRGAGRTGSSRSARRGWWRRCSTIAAAGPGTRSCTATRWC